MDEAWLAAARAAGDVAFAAMVGALALSAWLPDGEPPRRGRALALAAWAGGGALLAGLAWLWAESASLNEVPAFAALLQAGDLVTGTGFGRAWAFGWIASFAATVLAAAAARARHARARTWALAGAGAAVLVAAGGRAAVGHAAADGLAAAVALTALHLLATAAWAGGVIASALLLPADAGALPPAARVRFAHRLSTLATLALVVVLATGAWATWHALGGAAAALAPALDSTWGRLLAAKLAGVALAIGLGACNRFAVLPALAPAGTGVDAWRRFVGIVRVEALVMGAVLVLAALLAGDEPPQVSAYAPDAAPSARAASSSGAASLTARLSSSTV